MKKIKANSKPELLSRSKVVSKRRSSSYLDKLPEIKEEIYDNLPDFNTSCSGFIDMSIPRNGEL